MKIKRGDTDIDRTQGQQVKQRRAEFDFQRGLVIFSEHFLSKKTKKVEENCPNRRFLQPETRLNSSSLESINKLRLNHPNS